MSGPAGLGLWALFSVYLLVNLLKKPSILPLGVFLVLLTVLGWWVWCCDYLLPDFFFLFCPVQRLIWCVWWILSNTVTISSGKRELINLLAFGVWHVYWLSWFICYASWCHWLAVYFDWAAFCTLSSIIFGIYYSITEEHGLMLTR